jgi:hypothetical protein
MLLDWALLTQRTHRCVSVQLPGRYPQAYARPESLGSHLQARQVKTRLGSQFRLPDHRGHVQILMQYARCTPQHSWQTALVKDRQGIGYCDWLTRNSVWIHKLDCPGPLTVTPCQGTCGFVLLLGRSALLWKYQYNSIYLTHPFEHHCPNNGHLFRLVRIADCAGSRHPDRVPTGFVHHHLFRLI